jgi:hypothetical protein
MWNELRYSGKLFGKNIYFSLLCITTVLPEYQTSPYIVLSSDYVCLTTEKYIECFSDTGWSRRNLVFANAATAKAVA